MDSITVCLLGPLDWTRSVGKETSDTSFGVSAIKKDERVVNLVYPSKYPEKVWSLPFSLYLSDTVYLNVDKLDKDLGETVIALDLLGKRNGFVSIATDLDQKRAMAMFKGTVVEGYKMFDPNPAVLREELMKMVPTPSMCPTRVVVDQSFNVKGVGCVVLGFVTSGTLSRHQELTIAPGTKTTQVRSIQVQDRDFDVARAGARVGLALKGTAPEDVPRGCCLHSNEGIVIQGSSIRMEIRPSRFWKAPITEGARLHLASSLQFVPITIGPLEGAPYAHGAFVTTVTTDSPIWHSADETFSICFLDSKSFRLIATGKSF